MRLGVSGRGVWIIYARVWAAEGHFFSIRAKRTPRVGVVIDLIEGVGHE